MILMIALQNFNKRVNGILLSKKKSEVFKVKLRPIQKALEAEKLAKVFTRGITVKAEKKKEIKEKDSLLNGVEAGKKAGVHYKPIIPDGVNPENKKDAKKSKKK